MKSEEGDKGDCRPAGEVPRLFPTIYRKLKGWRWIFAGLIALVILGAAALSFLRQPVFTSAMRGYQVAQRMGCFACHGPGGRGGVPNPGSEEKEVPAWDGGMAMMYVEKEEEIREWILYGLPRRLWKDGKRPSGSSGYQYEQGVATEHGEGAEQPASAEVTSAGPLISMPGYEGLLSESEMADLVAYYKVVAVFEGPTSEDAGKGYRVASRLGCFGCHGPGGRGGAANPGSFKGIIPPWEGADFGELVKSDDELRQWILDGKIDRFESNPLARHFTHRQIIQMPAYRDILKEGELEALMAYIKWVRDGR